MRVLPIETGKARTASLRIDRCRRPYQGTDDLHDATQAYLDWEYALVAQLDLIAQRGAQRHILLLRNLSVVGIPCHHARPAAVRRAGCNSGGYAPNGSSGRVTSPTRLYSARIAVSTAAMSFS